ncbi:hypothetical protein [Kocuria palustris]
MRGTTGAAPTQFDGVFLDDMAMSPAQGQNMRDIGVRGPWGSDDGYGQAMLRTVAAIDDEVARRDGGARIAGNLGVYADYPNQQALALRLGQSRDLDWIFRESTIGGWNGAPLGPWYVTQQNGALMNRVAAAGTPVVMHNFAVNATTTPSASGGCRQQLPPGFHGQCREPPVPRERSPGPRHVDGPGGHSDVPGIRPPRADGGL